VILILVAKCVANVRNSSRNDCMEPIKALNCATVTYLSPANNFCILLLLFCIITIIMVHKGTSSSYRSVEYIRLWS